MALQGACQELVLLGLEAKMAKAEDIPALDSPDEWMI